MESFAGNVFIIKFNKETIVIANLEEPNMPKCDLET